MTHPSARRNLTNDFKAWLAKQDFSGAHKDEVTERKQRLEKAQNRFSGVLLCGLTAANHILARAQVPTISRNQIERIAAEIAEKEDVLLYSCSPGTVHDLTTDPRGNYAVDVLLRTIEAHTAMTSKRWKENEPILSSVLLVGCGQHWQAVLKDNREGKWYVHEEASVFFCPESGIFSDE